MYQRANSGSGGGSITQRLFWSGTIGSDSGTTMTIDHSSISNEKAKAFCLSYYGSAGVTSLSAVDGVDNNSVPFNGDTSGNFYATFNNGNIVIGKNVGSQISCRGYIYI